jgi:hypothetical protein
VTAEGVLAPAGFDGDEEATGKDGGIGKGGEDIPAVVTGAEVDGTTGEASEGS